MAEPTNLSCVCGAMHWQISAKARGLHIMCYCEDCQTFARHLGRSDYLQQNGGTDIFQTLPSNLRITSGAEHLALLRLSPKGLFRWYAKCCGTPVANTLTAPGFSFLGAILPKGHAGFGPIVAHVNTATTQGQVTQTKQGKAIRGALLRAIGARLTGAHKDTPFFRDGVPVVPADVLSLEEREAARPK